MCRIEVYIALAICIFPSIMVSASDVAGYEQDQQQIVDIAHGALFVMESPLVYRIRGDQFEVGARIGVQYMNEEINSNSKLPYKLNPCITQSYGTIPLDEIKYRKEGEIVLLKVDERLMRLKCSNKSYLPNEDFARTIRRLTKAFIQRPFCIKKDMERLLNAQVIVKDKKGNIAHGPASQNLIAWLKSNR
ncbi:MAG TPA: hypothetical protein VGT41_03985 [Candidatus Babeliales bacterium]|nr:hypothetical protein [Candidatus Babeliales bacterium]